MSMIIVEFSEKGISLTPCFWKELSDRCSLQLSEEGTSVNRAEVTYVSHPVQFLSDDRET